MISIGIEFSTQTVKIIAIDIHSGEVLYNDGFDYDNTFPHYATSGGVIDHDDPSIRHTSPFMIIEALEYAFLKLTQDKVDLSEVVSIKADAMQHCTVYTTENFGPLISSLSSENNLIEQVKKSSVITRNSVPIWEDRSPVHEIQYLNEILKPYGGIEKLTGNKAELRFPGPQILKWAKESPGEYLKTSHIFLLSSFITSILAGKITAVDTGDGWGTNLNTLDISNPGWSSIVINEINNYLAKNNIFSSLRSKLGAMNHYDTPAGKINQYFTKRYGINPETIVLTGTGDNPATLLGCGGILTISLGSSYTVNGIMESLNPSETGEYNIFGYTKNKAMALSVFTNGGKLHNHFARKYLNIHNKDTISRTIWEDYRQFAGEGKLHPDEDLMLPYLLNESVPTRNKGIIRDGFTDEDAKTNIRALYISQVLSLKVHSVHLSNPGAICIAGGGSKDRLLRQLISEVFQVPTFTLQYADYAAPLGCAISGARAILGITYNEATEKYTKKDHSTFINPDNRNRKAVDHLLIKYEELEKKGGLNV